MLNKQAEAARKRREAAEASATPEERVRPVCCQAGAGEAAAKAGGRTTYQSLEKSHEVF